MEQDENHQHRTDQIIAGQLDKLRTEVVTQVALLQQRADRARSRRDRMDDDLRAMQQQGVVFSPAQRSTFQDSRSF